MRRFSNRASPDKLREIALRQLEASRAAGELCCFFDGCTEPINPGGTAGWGAAIFQGGERVWQDNGFLPAHPTNSNNIAEYTAVAAIMGRIFATGKDQHVSVFGDSRLVVCQLWGWPAGSKKWLINGVDRPGQPKGHYADLAVAVRESLKALPNVKGYWIPRDLNDVADDLSKAHLRRLGVKFRIQPEGDQEHAT